MLFGRISRIDLDKVVTLMHLGCKSSEFPTCNSQSNLKARSVWTQVKVLKLFEHLEAMAVVNVVSFKGGVSISDKSLNLQPQSDRGTGEVIPHSRKAFCQGWYDPTNWKSSYQAIPSLHQIGLPHAPCNGSWNLERFRVGLGLYGRRLGIAFGCHHHSQRDVVVIVIIVTVIVVVIARRGSLRLEQSIGFSRLKRGNLRPSRVFLLVDLE